jgi:CubicO group peptidase (beta-lactamase class C family)
MNRRSFLQSTLLLTAIPEVLPQVAFAQGTSLQDDSLPMASSGDPRFEKLCQKYIKLGLPAVWIAVADKGRLLGASCAGFRDVSGRKPAGLGDSVGYGSITKPFTGLMIAALVAERKLSYDRPVIDYLPDIANSFEGERRNITLGHLVTHMSGLATGPKEPKERYKDGTAYRRQFALNGLLKPSVHSVGTAYSYSNIGITIAALAAERVTGKSWERLIQDKVTIPLKLSSIMPHPEIDDKQFHCYDLSAAGLTDTIDQEVIQRNRFGPAGCLQGTALDLMKFGLAFLSPKTLPPPIQSSGIYPLLVHAAHGSKMSHCAIACAERPQNSFRLSHGGSLIAGRYRGYANLRVNSLQGRAVAIATNVNGYGEGDVNEYSKQVATLIEAMNNEVESYL